MQISRAFALVAAAWVLLAGGCSQGILDTKWKLEDTANKNRAAMRLLKPGMGLDEVTRMMAGDPYLADSYKGKNGENILVYKYLTQPVFDYSQLKADDITPVVFVNGVLDGWNWPHLEAASAKYGFTAKPRDK